MEGRYWLVILPNPSYLLYLPLVGLDHYLRLYNGRYRGDTSGVTVVVTVVVTIVLPVPIGRCNSRESGRRPVREARTAGTRQGARRCC